MFLSQQTLLAGTSGYLPAWTQTAEEGPYRGGVTPAESISAHTPWQEGCSESLLSVILFVSRGTWGGVGC